MEDLRAALSGWLDPQMVGAIVLDWSGRMAAGLAIFLIGGFVASALTGWFGRAVQRVGMDKTLASFFGSLIYIVLIVMVVLTAVTALGVPTTHFLAIIGAAGLAVGLALKDSLSNFTAESTRRVDLMVAISYEDSIGEAKKLLRELVRADKRFLQTPDPEFVVNDLGANGVNIAVRAWVATADQPARGDLLERIKNAFAEHGLTIPYPRMRLDRAAGVE